LVRGRPAILPKQMLFGHVWTILQLYKRGFPSATEFEQELMRYTQQDASLTDDNPLDMACFLCAYTHLHEAVHKLKNAKGVLIKKYQEKVEELVQICEQGIPTLRTGQVA
jgi:hypothetical protein